MSWRYRPICDVGLFAPTKTGYYGAFYNGSLERMRLFLGAQIQDEILHVCSGALRHYPCYGLGPNDKLVDARRSALVPKKGNKTRRLQLRPDYVMDVSRELPVRVGGWRAILADAPWSEEEAKNYGTATYPDPVALLRKCLEHVRPGGRVGFLHWEAPRPPATVHGCKIHFVATLPMMLYGRTWRGVNVFEKRIPQKRLGDFKVKP